MAATTYGIKAGKAFVLIEAVDLTAKVLNNVRNRLAKFGSEMSQLGQTMALRSAAALTPVAFSLRTFASFDDSMRTVEARSKGTAGEMDNLRAIAMELGRTTAFTASHIGNMMARLAQFGKTRAEIAQMTEPIMLLARAGGGGKDLNEDIINATDAVTQVLAAYKMEAEDTTKVTDLLSATVNNSKFSLEELGTSLQYAAPAAHNFGMSVEETLAALAAIRELGIDASIAGTALRNMFLYVSQAKERDDFNEKLQEMTGSLIQFTDESGNLRNMNEILLAITEALKDVSNLDASDLITQLFETRATVPAMGIGKSIETLARMRKILSDVDGTSRRTSEQMETGMGGAFRVLESAIEGVAISLGTALNNTILTTSGSTEIAIKAVSDWIKANQGLVTAVVASVALIGAFGVSLIVLGQTLRMLSGLFLLFTVPLQAVSILLSPSGLIIAGLLAFIALLPQISSGMKALMTDFGNTLDSLSKSWQETFKGITVYLAAGDIQSAFELLSAQVQLTWSSMLDHLLTAWEGFMSNFSASPATDALISASEGSIQRMEQQLANTPAGPLRESRQYNLDQARRDLDALRATQQGLLDEASAPHEARQKEIDSLKERLRLLQDSAEIYRQLQTEAPSSSTSSAPTDFSMELDKLKAAAGNLVVPVLNGPQGAPKALEGVEKGSVEAAKAIQEAKFNLMQKAMDKVAAYTKESADSLEEIRAKIAEIGEGALVGV